MKDEGGQHNFDDEEFGFENDDSSVVEEWITIKTTSSEIEAEMYKSNLTVANIPAEVFSTAVSVFPIPYGDLSDYRIMIPIKYKEKASSLINSIDGNDSSNKPES